MAFLGDGPPKPPPGNWEFNNFRKPKDPNRGMPAWVIVALMIAIAITVKVFHDNGYF